MNAVRGRHREREVLDRLLASVRDGHSRALVLYGEAGVGKTALLDHLHRHASGCRTVRAVGTAPETDVAFAGLHQLCAAFLSRLDRLPAPQRDALAIAFSMCDGDAPQRFAIATGTLSLLSEVAGERPLICLVDDAQWLDPASAWVLAFVARHMTTAPVAIVFAARRPQGHLTGLPVLEVDGLRDTDARDLLNSAVRWPLDSAVRDRMLAECRGNPRTLLDLARGMTPADLAGGFGLPNPLPLPEPVRDGFLDRYRSLPANARLLLLLAAAEPTGDPALLWRAAGRLGLGVHAANQAAVTGMLEIGRHVIFPHPLVRSVVYRSAPPDDRLAVHAALADVADRGADPSRRTWHRAQALVEPDEEIAAALERSVAGAHARGGCPAAGAFLERSAELTADPVHRARRRLAAAEARFDAGTYDAALALLAAAEAEPLDQLHSARADLLRGLIASVAGNGGDASGLLIKAAERLEPLDPRLAAETYRDAFQAAVIAGRLAVGGGMREAAEAVRPLTATLEQPALTLLLEGLAALAVDGYADAAPILKHALKDLRADESLSGPSDLRWLLLACCMARHLWDDASFAALARRLVDHARTAGALTALQTGLHLALVAEASCTGLAAADALAAEADRVADATGAQRRPYGTLMIAAWRGREAEVASLIATTTTALVTHGEGQWLTAAYWATAVLNNGLGRYGDALAAAEQGIHHTGELSLATWLGVELIEAAARSGQTTRAAGALRSLCETTAASGSDWGLGVEARSRALLGVGKDAERWYREAIERLGRTRERADLARAHLVYGEWLRRQTRRVDARVHLRAAHDMFTAMGFEAFAARARSELAVTGEMISKRSASPNAELTPQEKNIARLASEGLTNPQIATQLFLSSRTVEWHLRKVFIKLGISSRTELRTLLVPMPAT